MTIREMEILCDNGYYYIADGVVDIRIIDSLQRELIELKIEIETFVNMTVNQVLDKIKEELEDEGYTPIIEDNQIVNVVETGYY